MILSPGTNATCVTAAALRESRRFFALPLSDKASLVSDLSYAGYVASGEEVTAGERDFSEIFTVCKDLPTTDPRVRAGWPCHGPVPWSHEPNQGFLRALAALAVAADRIGEVREAERCAGFLRDSSAEAADLLLPASPV